MRAGPDHEGRRAGGAEAVRCWWCHEPITRDARRLECRFKRKGRLVTRLVPVHRRCVTPMIERYLPDEAKP